MNPRALKSNDELAGYLARLDSDLRQRGASELAERVGRASRFLSGSSSEFLHETELALTSVRESHGGKLSHAEESEIQSVLLQIREAFAKIGGA